MDRFADLVLLPISLFSGKGLAVSIALLILSAAIGLLAAIRFVFEKPFLSTYNELTTAVASERRRTASQARAIANLEGVFANSALAEAWGQYKATFEFSDNRAFNHSDPAPFFESDRLDGHNYPKWSSTLGGVFLTVGLFFTFVGLSAALLQVAPDGHGGALSPDKLRTAVENILGISSVKFITSLAGILAYIVWSIAARAQADAQERAVGRLVAEVRRLSTYVSPEKLLFEQLTAVREQHQQFQAFGADLAVAIGDRIDHALGQSFATLSTEVANSVGAKVAESLAPVCTQLEAIGSTIGQAGGQIANGAGDVFSRVWKTSMEAPISAFGSEMQKIVGALQGLPETVAKLEASLGGRIGSASNDLSGAVERLNESFGTQQRSMMGAVADFNAKVAGIPDIVAAASRSSVDQIGTAVEETLGKMSRITQAAGESSAERLSSEVGKIAGALAASAQALKAASEASSTSIAQAGGDLGKGVRESIKAVQDASIASGEELKTKVESLAKVVEDLCGALARSTIQLDAQQRDMKDAGGVVSAASSSLKTAADGVAQAAAPLASTLGALRTAVEGVTTASNQLRQTSEAERQTADSLKTTSEAARRAFDEQANRFGDLQNSVRQTAQSLVEGVQQLADEITKCVGAYDNAISNSIGGLENAILELVDVADDKPKKAVRG